MFHGTVKREGGRLVVRTSLPRTLLAALASTLFVVAGAWLCVGSLLGVFKDSFDSPSARLLVFAVGAATLLSFGFGSGFLVGRLLSFRRPIFEVGPEGILDRSSALGAGFMPWEEVEEVRSRRFLGYRYLGVRVRDARVLLARQSLPKRYLMNLNRRFTGTPVNVPLSALAIRDTELLREIERHLPGLARS